MSGFIALLGGLAMLGVVAALFFGLFSMVRSGGGEADSRRSNRLMRWRVILQGAALLLIGLAMLLSGRG